MSKRLLLGLWLVCLVINTARADDADAYEQALPSVVWLSVVDTEWKQSFGTGIVIDAKNGFVLTAHHVAPPSSLVMGYHQTRTAGGDLVVDPSTVQTNALQTNSMLRCVVVARDAKRDLALLKILNPPKDLKAMPLASQSAKPGQGLFTIGNSMTGPLWRYASGNVRQVYHGQMKYDNGQIVVARLVESTVPINGGDSGGPLITQNGVLVGLNASFQANLNQIYYAIDIQEIRAFFTDSIKPESRITESVRKSPTDEEPKASPPPPAPRK